MKPPRTREADPLPPPSEGSIEVDPFSLPPPEGGYENLELDDPPAAPAPASDAATAERDRAGAAADATPAVPAPLAAETDDERAAPAGRVRSRGPAVAVAAAAAALVLALGAWLLLRGRSGDGSRSGIRVTVTQDAQEAPWNSAPPLAPVDPTYVERRREDDAPARVAATPPSRAAAATPVSHAAAARGPRPREADAPAAAPSPPAEIEVSPPPPLPVPVQEASATAPAPAATAAPEIPLPPPPVVAAPRPPVTRGRAPVLQTQTCVDDALRIPRGLEGRLPPEIVVRVEVGTDGRPGEVSVPGPADARLAGAVAAAVRTCRFTPGTTGEGQPVAAATTMRIRFE